MSKVLLFSATAVKMKQLLKFYTGIIEMSIHCSFILPHSNYVTKL